MSKFLESKNTNNQIKKLLLELFQIEILKMEWNLQINHILQVIHFKYTHKVLISNI